MNVRSRRGSFRPISSVHNCFRDFCFQQFVWSEFSEEYRPTERRETFYPSVVLADRLYELKITDLPTIPYFPVSSHLEWTDFRYYGLRSATAYVLVFDLSNQDTFQVFTIGDLMLKHDKLRAGARSRESGTSASEERQKQDSRLYFSQSFSRESFFPPRRKPSRLPTSSRVKLVGIKV